MIKHYIMRNFRRSNNSTHLNLDVDIRNFGPISKAHISLKPLTILVGPNNSGKSYAAALIHSIVSSQEEFAGLPWWGRYKPRIEPRSKLANEMTVCKNRIRDLIKNKGHVDVPTDLMDIVAKLYIETVTKDVLIPRIEYIFGSSISNMTKIGSKSLSITITTDSKNKIVINDKKIPTSRYSKLGISSSIEFVRASRRTLLEYELSNNHVVYKVNPDWPEHIQLEHVMSSMHDYLSDVISSGLPSDSHHLPAARSGVLQGHKALTINIIKNAAHAGLDPLVITKLSGITSDFISTIIDMPQHKGPFFNIAQDLEKNILGGKINISVDARTGSSEIQYRYKRRALPLHLTSSTVSELAPLILYLKYVVRKGDLIILEEPEAHLHPRMQIILARYIVKMIRHGINILIMTHSIFVYNLLSQFLMSSKTRPKTSKKLNFDEDDYLEESEISAYSFEKLDVGSYVAKSMDHSAEEGMPSNEFSEAIDTMYNGRIIIEQNMP